MKKTIHYFFDFLSPYSYLSWETIQKRKAEFSDFTWEYYPIVMGKLFQHWEQKGPAQIRPKMEYLLKKCMRTAKESNIIFTLPAKLPFNSIFALRLSLTEVGQENQHTIIDTLWKAGWQEGLDLEDPDLLIQILNKKNLMGEQYLELSCERKYKQCLKENIKKATELNLFGVPSFILDGELFWGNDSINDLIKYIKKEDSLERDLYLSYLKKIQI